MVTTYHGDEHPYLRGHKVIIIAVLKNAAKPGIDVDGPEYSTINDDAQLERAGGVTADDRLEVKPWLKEEERYSFVASDPRAIDLALFRTLVNNTIQKTETKNSRTKNLKRMKSKRYPVQFQGETRHVTVPGSGDQQPGPNNETEFEKFLAEAIEAYSEASDINQPRLTPFSKTRALKRYRGLVVRIGEKEFRLTIVRSR